MRTGTDPAVAVAVEIDGRQDYVAETDRLKEMLGASRLIANLVSEARARFSERQGLHLFGPVSGEVRAWARAADRDRLLDAAWQLCRWLHDKGIAHTAAVIEADAKEFEAEHGSLTGVHAALSDRARAVRGSGAGVDTEPRCALFTPCRIHGADPATEWEPDEKSQPDERRRLTGYRAKAKLDGWMKERNAFYGRLLEIEDPTASFDDLTRDLDTGSKRDDQYLAFVQADADGLGALLRAIDWNSPAWHDGRKAWQRNAAFADELAAHVEDALGEAIRSTYPEAREQRRLRLLPQIIGGDDIWIVCERSRALVLISTFGKHVEDEARLARSDRGTLRRALGLAREISPDAKLTLSFGVAFAKAGYPASAMIEASAQLLGSAKERRRCRDAGTPAEGCLDWHWIESSTLEPVADARAHDTRYVDKSSTGGLMQLTTRPWTLGEADAFAAAVVPFNRIARRKREQLHHLLRLGRPLSELAWLEWWNGLGEKGREALVDANKSLPEPVRLEVQKSPWREVAGDGRCVSPLLDLVALGDVLGKDEM